MFYPEEPYAPERYIKAIKLCEESNTSKVSLFVSSTKNGRKRRLFGDCEQLGGRFQDWSRVTHNSYRRYHSNLNVRLSQLRSKVDYSLTIRILVVETKVVVGVKSTEGYIMN
jgi:hypothetical protein